METNNKDGKIGWIIDGPNREQLFDSLRLGLRVKVTLITLGGKKFVCEVVINSIADIPLLMSLDEWTIKFLFNIGEAKDEIDTYYWEGQYSTKGRTGQPNKLPPTLFVSLGEKDGEGWGAKLKFYTPGRKKLLGKLIFHNLNDWQLDLSSSADAHESQFLNAALKMAKEKYPNG